MPFLFLLLRLDSHSFSDLLVVSAFNNILEKGLSPTTKIGKKIFFFQDIQWVIQFIIHYNFLWERSVQIFLVRFPQENSVQHQHSRLDLNTKKGKSLMTQQI